MAEYISSTNSIHLLRDKANENIKKFCEARNEDYQQARNFIYNEADSFNVLLPLDFYVKVYNLSIELLIQEGLKK